MANKTYLKTTLAIFAISVLLAQLTFAASPRYEIIDLGTLGGDYSFARSINNNAQIVGSARNPRGALRATLFDPTGGGNNIDLGTLESDWDSSATSINNHGQIVGYASVNNSADSHATLFDPTGGANNTDLGTLGGHHSYARSISDTGQIVGSAENTSGVPYATLFDSTGAGNNINLGTLGGKWSFACSINNDGQIVGKARNRSQIQRATLFDPTGEGNNVDLGTLSGIYSSALSINEKGQIVGHSEIISGNGHAALFDPTGNGNNIDLGTLDGAECWAESINNVGQIVGLTENDSEDIRRAVLIDSSGSGNNIDLNALINPASGWTLEFAYAINDNGWIVGLGVNPDGDTHAYLLIPKPAIIYVDADATGNNDGSSWPDAYNYLQDALTTAWSGDEIRVAQGVYKPDQGDGITTGDRTATFQLINGVTLKGGYAGASSGDAASTDFGQPDPNARDIQLYETILTGDLDGNDVQVNYPCDLLDEPTRSENSYHVVTGSGTDKTAILNGITITAGNANGPSFWPLYLHDRGGGIRHTGQLAIANCTLISNSSEVYGGGIYNYIGTYDDEWPTLTNCKFIRNSSGYSGGGISTHNASAMITNCTFVGNCATSAGGGINSDNYNCLTLTNCTFKSNSAGWSGGGILSMDDYSLTLTNCTFTGNSAMFGGGVYKNDDIYCDNANLIVSNCTFTGNIATYECGGIFAGTALDCNQIITNSILSGNTDSGGVDESAQVDLWGFVDYVNYNCIQGLTGALGGIGNIDAAPLFIDPGYWADANDPNIVVEPNDPNAIWIDGDYHLLAGSPCIDAGDPNYIAEPNETDLDGRPRVIGRRVDMGAYEYSGPLPAELRIIPRTINLASKGKWITCYIWLPEDYNVADIDPNSVLLEGEIQAESLKLDEEQQVAIAKFSRSEVQGILNVGEVELTITGQLTDGTIFEGTDVIRVIDKAGKN